MCLHHSRHGEVSILDLFHCQQLKILDHLRSISFFSQLEIATSYRFYYFSTYELKHAPDKEAVLLGKCASLLLRWTADEKRSSPVAFPSSIMRLKDHQHHQAIAVWSTVISHRCHNGYQAEWILPPHKRLPPHSYHHTSVNFKLRRNCTSLTNPVKTAHPAVQPLTFEHKSCIS